jgi:hypothetical protein
MLQSRRYVIRDPAMASNLDGIDLAALQSVVAAVVVTVVSYAKGRGLVVGVWVTGSLDVERVAGGRSRSVMLIISHRQPATGDLRSVRVAAAAAVV